MTAWYTNDQQSISSIKVLDRSWLSIRFKGRTELKRGIVNMRVASA